MKTVLGFWGVKIFTLLSLKAIMLAPDNAQEIIEKVRSEDLVAKF